MKNKKLQFSQIKLVNKTKAGAALALAFLLLISSSTVLHAQAEEEQKDAAEEVYVPEIAVCADSGGKLADALRSAGAHVTQIDSKTDISRFDGLLVPGGRDVDPYMYGEKVNGATGYMRSFDQEQIKIIDKFVKEKKPILAVCRGAQLMNVYFGGSLYQNISGHKTNRTGTTTNGSLLRTILGASKTISCGHHQCVKKLGDNLIVTMRASDGRVEGYEHAYLPILGVQWHIENISTGKPVIKYFVKEMCAKGAYDRTTLLKDEGGWHRYESGVETDISSNSIVYRTHVQTYGWLEHVADGAVSGTSGEGKRMEAAEIELVNPEWPDSGITYQTHVQSYGWRDWVSDGVWSGSSGEGKRMEAIRIKLTGEMADHYDVFYRVHAQHYGWLGWAKNGQAAGTAGYAYRLEAMEVRLVEKGSADAPVQDAGNQAFRNKSGHTHDYVPEAHVEGSCKEQGLDRYSCYCGKIKEEAAEPEPHENEILEQQEPTCTDDGYVRQICKNCETETTEVIPAKGHVWDDGVAEEEQITYTCQVCEETRTCPIAANIAYRTHVQTYGWLDYVTNGAMSGTSGEAKRMEAINIHLEEPLPVSGGVEYRTHVQTYGWLKWQADDALSGTSGEGKRMEAIEIRLTGEMAEQYDIYYCVHAQHYGWLNWAKNGESAGTAGYAYRLEAVRIQIVPKGEPAPEKLGTRDQAFKKK